MTDKPRAGGHSTSDTSGGFGDDIGISSDCAVVSLDSGLSAGALLTNVPGRVAEPAVAAKDHAATAVVLQTSAAAPSAVAVRTHVGPVPAVVVLPSAQTDSPTWRATATAVGIPRGTSVMATIPPALRVAEEVAEAAGGGGSSGCMPLAELRCQLFRCGMFDQRFMNSLPGRLTQVRDVKVCLRLR